MSELLYAIPFWTAVPAMALARRGRLRAAWIVLGAAPVSALLLDGGSWRETAAAAVVAGASAFCLFLLWRSSRHAIRAVRVRTRIFRRSLRRARMRVEDLSVETRRRHAVLDRLQSRFSLVQGMATRLDTGVLLQSLGSLWAEVAGVRRVVLLQRRPNRNWMVAYSHGMPAPEKWVGLLEAHPELANGKRLHKHASADKMPFLREHGAEPPFFLVPVAWGDDVMALGYVEVTPALFREEDGGFDTERKLVSIGLRRAFLYDLMSERSRHDGLTGALLRRTFMDRLQESVRKSLRYQTPLFIAIFDIDHFKEVNDTHGHPAGDRALVQVARVVRDRSEPGVTLGRLGGDEFAVVMEVRSMDAALAWLESLRKDIAAAVLKEGDKDIRLTISAGLAPFFPEKLSPDAFLARADEALYRAKREGRNRVAVVEPRLPPAEN